MVSMENKMKSADEIVRALVSQGEPFYEDSVDGELACALCNAMHAEDWRKVEVPLDECGGVDDGLSFVGHDANCAWRMAVEYVKAAGK